MAAIYITVLKATTKFAIGVRQTNKNKHGDKIAR